MYKNKIPENMSRVQNEGNNNSESLLLCGYGSLNQSMVLFGFFFFFWGGGGGGGWGVIFLVELLFWTIDELEKKFWRNIYFINWMEVSLSM